MVDSKKDFFFFWNLQHELLHFKYIINIGLFGVLFQINTYKNMEILCEVGAELQMKII